MILTKAVHSKQETELESVFRNDYFDSSLGLLKVHDSVEQEITYQTTSLVQTSINGYVTVVKDEDLEDTELFGLLEDPVAEYETNDVKYSVYATDVTPKTVVPGKKTRLEIVYRSDLDSGLVAKADGDIDVNVNVELWRPSTYHNTSNGLYEIRTGVKGNLTVVSNEYLDEIISKSGDIGELQSTTFRTWPSGQVTRFDSFIKQLS